MYRLTAESPISTYSRRATTKPGCKPDEHYIIYIRGTRPTLLPNEQRLSKEPIAVNPVSPYEFLDPASRIHFGKTYHVQRDVQAKEIGDVVQQDLARLLLYYRVENR